MCAKEYRFKFYLNATHFVNLNTQSKTHPHTWELVLHIKKIETGFIQFTQLEEDLRKFLVIYEGKFLNEIPPFIVIEPTMENIGLVFFNTIKIMLEQSGWDLRRLEISENPTRTFIVSDEGDYPAKSIDTSEALLDDEAAESTPVKEIVAALEEAAPSLEEAAPPPAEAAPVLAKISEYTSPCKAENSISPELTVNLPRGTMKAFEEELSRTFAKERPSVKKKEHHKAELARDTALKTKPWKILAGYLLILGTALGTAFWMIQSGFFPWGSDSWYHVFKADLLYQEMQKGNLFPLYSELWYNGIQPLRYWAPLPHYLMSFFLFLSGGSIEFSYNAFIVLIFVLGATGWMLWGRKTRRFGLGLALGLLWFFLPDNIRVLFSEGNLSRVTVTALFPYLLLALWVYLERRDRKALFLISILMMIITFCHAMIAAMAGICVFLFMLFYCALERKWREFFESLAATLLGILLAGIWLFPALKGGLVSMDTGAVSELMRSLTYPFMESLDPLLRFKNADSFYFGLSILVITLLGIWLGDKKSKAGFIVTAIIFIGTSRELVGFLQKLPMSQLFWMMRFTPLAMATFFAGLLLWKKLKKNVLILCIILIAADGLMSFYLLGHNSGMPQMVKESMDDGMAITSSRVALFDNSSFGSFPSFYLASSEEGKPVRQVFGSGWQGAETADNIMWLNTALQKGWYEFLFDRCLEHGADTIILKNDNIRDRDAFTQTAQEFGYMKISDDGLCSTFKLKSDGLFGTTAEYKGLAIGRYASNLAFLFPSIQIAENVYLDQFIEEELLDYELVFLSGFDFIDKEKAEKLVISLSQKGVRVVVDLTGQKGDVFSSNPRFLGVSAQPVEFKDQFPSLSMGKNSYDTEQFPADERQWLTFYLENLDSTEGTSEFNYQQMDFMGSKANDNIRFIGFNLPYFAVQTHDRQSISILERITGLKASEPPRRELVKLNVINGRNDLTIYSEKDNVLTGIAYLDTFQSQQGGFSEVHNMVRMNDNILKLKVNYPYLKESLLISLIGLAGCVFLNFYIHSVNKHRNGKGVDGYEK